MRLIGWTYAALGAALIGLCAISLPFSSTTNAIAYSLIGVLATAAVLVGTARHRPDRRAPWLCITAGQATWVLANTFYLGLLPLDGIDGQLIGTVLYLLGNVVVVAAMWQMMFHRCRGARLASSLDATMLAIGMALTVWVLVGRPVISGAAPASGDTSIGLAFVMFDIAIAASAWAVLTTPGARTPAFFLMICAMGLQLAGDSSYLTTALNDALGTYAASVAWIVSTLLWGGAALHPSMRALTSPGTAEETGLTSSRLVVLALAVLVGPVAAYVEVGTVQSRDVIVLACSVLLVLLTMARMALALRATLAALRTTEDLRDAMTLQAQQDPLTGLANRTQMRAQLHTLLTLTAAGRAAPFKTHPVSDAAQVDDDRQVQSAGAGVLLIDLDGFKRINDSLGHAAGDAALCQVAQRLNEETRSSDCVARLGGDEFVVVLGHVDTAEQVLQTAQRLLETITRPASWQGHQLDVGASIGAAFSRDAAVTAEALLAEADAATYRAKAGGGNRVVVFDEAARTAAETRVRLESSLWAVLQHETEPHEARSPLAASGTGSDGDPGEFPPAHTGVAYAAGPKVSIHAEGALELHHQPVVALGTGEQHGVEALIRWRRHDGVVIPPDAFIPLAETSDLICEVGRWVLRTGCGQLAAWASDPQRRHWRMAVNISARHLKHPGVVDDVLDALSATGARAELLTVEVTETVLVDSPAVIEHLHQLRAVGVQVAIDDFGTGYTSISQLQHLPADYLKIDRSLVAAEDPATADLVRLVVRAASAFGLVVIAEGIERQDQHQALLAAGASLGQGWLFGRPQAPELPKGTRDLVPAITAVDTQ